MAMITESILLARVTVIALPPMRKASATPRVHFQALASFPIWYAQWPSP